MSIVCWFSLSFMSKQITSQPSSVYWIANSRPMPCAVPVIYMYGWTNSVTIFKSQLKSDIYFVKWYYIYVCLRFNYIYVRIAYQNDFTTYILWLVWYEYFYEKVYYLGYEFYNYHNCFEDNGGVWTQSRWDGSRTGNTEIIMMITDFNYIYIDYLWKFYSDLNI